MFVTWLIHMCSNTTHSYVWQHTFIYVWRTRGSKAYWIVFRATLRRLGAAWHALSHTFMGRMTHSYVWHDSFMCVTWLGHMCDVTRSYVWLDSFICATWLVHLRDMTRSHVWHDSFICVTWQVALITNLLGNAFLLQQPLDTNKTGGSHYKFEQGWRGWVIYVTWPVGL